MAASSDPVRADVEWIARDYWAILKAARPEELDLPTNGTAWTNRQLLFHMLLGQRVTRMVIVVMGVFSRLPAGASRAWAAGMAAVTTVMPFEMPQPGLARRVQHVSLGRRRAARGGR